MIDMRTGYFSISLAGGIIITLVAFFMWLFLRWLIFAAPRLAFIRHRTKLIPLICLLLGGATFCIIFFATQHQSSLSSVDLHKSSTPSMDTPAEDLPESILPSTDSLESNDPFTDLFDSLDNCSVVSVVNQLAEMYEDSDREHLYFDRHEIDKIASFLKSKQFTPLDHLERVPFYPILQVGIFSEDKRIGWFRISYYILQIGTSPDSYKSYVCSDKNFMLDFEKEMGWNDIGYSLYRQALNYADFSELIHSLNTCSFASVIIISGHDKKQFYLKNKQDLKKISVFLEEKQFAPEFLKTSVGTHDFIEVNFYSEGNKICRFRIGGKKMFLIDTISSAESRYNCNGDIRTSLAKAMGWSLYF